MHALVAVDYAAIFHHVIGLGHPVDGDAFDVECGGRGLRKLRDQIVGNAGNYFHGLEAQFLFLRRRARFIVAGRPGMQIL